jgi:hypothetical protein
MNRTSRYISELLNASRIEEESSITNTAFVGTMAKGYKYSLLATSIIGIGMGYFLSVPIQDPAVGVIFGMSGLVALLMLPTFFSYRCYVDKSTMKETYYILCFRIKKEALWKDVKYKRVKRDSNGNAYAIHLYNINKKKLISFDYGVVGFGKIVKMAKNIPSLKH